MKLFSLLLLITSLFSSAIFSSTIAVAETGSNSKIETVKGIQGVDMLRLALRKSMPGVKPTKITESPIAGLYEVIVGSQVVYMSVDARYMIEGDLHDFLTKTNVSENAKSGIRLSAINQFDEKDMLIYTPEKVSDTITVITDIDCPYCRRLHNEIPQYMENNIEVRYIFMPIKGASDMKKTISVWCSEDQQTALNIAKAGGEVEAKTCDNPIDEHMKLARTLGVRGTPAILLEDGSLLPGYVPVDKLVAELRK